MEQGRISVPHEGAPTACEPVCEERTAPRFTLLIRAAKVVTPAGEFICVIRDVSQSGVSLRGFHALPENGPHWLELQTGERYAIEPIERGAIVDGNVERPEVVAEALLRALRKAGTSTRTPSTSIAIKSRAY